MRKFTGMGALAIIVIVFAGVGIVPDGAKLTVAIVQGCLLTLATALRLRWRSLALVIGLWVLVLTMISIARVVGGGDREAITLEGMRRLAWFVMLVTLFGALSASLPAREVLATADWVRVSRSVTYVLLTVVALVGFVGVVGRRQVALLRLKGLIPRTANGRFTAYARLLGPLVAVLLRRQLANAESLVQRGFFDERLPSARMRAISSGELALLGALILGVGIAWWFARSG